MHKAVAIFLAKVKSDHPSYFLGKGVLDCGSLDINGSNRQFFISCQYTGIDILQGKNVDIVTPVNKYQPGVFYDVVISTEMLEHDREYTRSLVQMFWLLKPGGLLIITAAAFGRKEHGTTLHSPRDSPMTNEYYKPVGIHTFAGSLPMERFSKWSLTSNSLDIQFYGVKKTIAEG